MKKGEKFERLEISQELYKQLRKEQKKITSAKLLIRIQSLIYIYLGWKYSKVAECLGISNNCMSNWIKLYKEGGIKSLLELRYKGGQPKLTSGQLNELKEKSSKGSFPIAKAMQNYIEKKFGIRYCLSSMHFMLKKRFYSHLKRQ